MQTVVGLSLQGAHTQGHGGWRGEQQSSRAPLDNGFMAGSLSPFGNDEEYLLLL